MKKSKFLKALSAILAALVIGSIAYVQNYYHSENEVQAYFQETGSVTLEKIEEGLFVDGPGNQDALVFYPGAKVEYTAYLPLMYEIAEQGVDVFLIHMPCNLAFLGKDKAGDLMQSYEYSQWYLGGHSLGGAMAAVYASEHLEEFDGLVLLAAYPTKDLKADDFSVLSLYGSEDQVLHMEKVVEGREFMPEDYTEICIEGGNHAQFGNYGDQKGDGDATISKAEQQKQTVTNIIRILEQ